jgi:hypothetical protein
MAKKIAELPLKILNPTMIDESNRYERIAETYKR